MNWFSRLLCLQFYIASSVIIGSVIVYQENNLLDCSEHDADQSYKIGYDDLVLDTQYLLDDIVDQMIIFKTWFSPVHHRLLMDMHRLFVAISNEFYPFIREYEYLYGYSSYDIATLRAVLLDLYDAMTMASISGWLRYDYELEVIIDFLVGALDEMRRPLLDLYSIRYVADNLDRVRYSISIL